MVVPDSAGVLQPQADHGSSTSGLIKNSAPGYEEEDQELAGVELEEVRKLQELVRRLEVQNQSLRNRGKNIHHGGATNSNHPVGSNINKHLSCDEVTNAPLSLVDRVEELSSRDFELSPPLDSNSCKDMSPLPQTNRLEEDDGEDEDGSACEGFLTLPCCNGGQGQGQILEQGCLTPDSPSLDSYESETMAESDSGVDQSALDEVDVLDLEEEGVEVEDEDSWLYVSPKKQIAKPGPESPLKWCRKVLDHPSPETEVACRTLINRLDQTSRWKNIYSSPSTSVEAGCSSSGLLSPGYHKSTNKPLLTCGSSGYMSIHSALSSQSSIDSELSTSDDSISMGYKLQDLTDVQIMARLQEDSLRQDYASSSASVSRRSSSASLQSLRRGGTYSDQEFDSYSLEDEEDACCSLPQRRPRYSPSPLGSPRCLSPSTQGQGEYHQSRLGATRTRAPRRSLQGPSPELLKFAKSEEELRHSMPNLAPRTSLRTLEAVRNSRSMEANLQSSGGRMSRLTHSSPSSGVNSSRLRSSGQSPLSLRAPVKAIGPVSSMTGVRQPSRGLPVVQNAGPTGGVRRVQSPGQSNSGAYPSGRAMPEAGRPTTARGQVGTTPTPGGRVSQTPRSLGISSRGPMLDESWKEGCY
ncbi:SLAIN motif-containing protein-like isoform X1 [Hypomesus transpacificus]|uniref:SLAIN motif-containing protein-like isoform X1 n=1 Tax=Hypomesus transpacificus TaxID=137520 RepID=UPI001F07BF57|nr:SLAIN motif-containing protein-like isoform X1 [Hypomesus transpacificus]XP_046907199.1 SLAIN motif-containing protein-like isoform X1 [Hypomesus transpacificus]XP_046907200.1 SLAIN motif-containing protein-like isoform X1 [Hypomesus transpacificus]